MSIDVCHMRSPPPGAPSLPEKKVSGDCLFVFVLECVVALVCLNVSFVDRKVSLFSLCLKSRALVRIHSIVPDLIRTSSEIGNAMSPAAVVRLSYCLGKKRGHHQSLVDFFLGGVTRLGLGNHRDWIFTAK